MSDAGLFWSMGGYARFVWPCFGVAFAVLTWNVLSARRFLATARVGLMRARAMAASEPVGGSDPR